MDRITELQEKLCEIENTIAWHSIQMEELSLLREDLDTELFILEEQQNASQSVDV